MGVYIKGMEMPKSCRDCDFMNWGAVEPNRCGITDCFIGGDYDKRHDNCPLVPVPKHGRLIDADSLKSDGFYTIVCYTGKMPYEYTAMLIDDAPTVIEAEEGET